MDCHLKSLLIDFFPSILYFRTLIWILMATKSHWIWQKWLQWKKEPSWHLNAPWNKYRNQIFPITFAWRKLPYVVQIQAVKEAIFDAPHKVEVSSSRLLWFFSWLSIRITSSGSGLTASESSAISVISRREMKFMYRMGLESPGSWEGWKAGMLWWIQNLRS